MRDTEVRSRTTRDTEGLSRTTRDAAPLLGLLAGAVGALGWQSTAWWPTAFLGVIALGWLVMYRHGGQERLRRAAWIGWCYGLGQGLVALGWVHVIGWYVVPPLLAAMACWQALVGVGLAATARLVRHPLARAVLGACTWVLAEFGASRVPFGGFGWLRLAYTQVDSPLAGWLPAIGVAGLGLVVALVGHLLLAAAMSAGRSRAAALVAILVLALGAPLANRIPAGELADEQPVDVGVVQGNVNGSAGPDAMGYARSVTDNHVSQTVTLMARARAGLDPMPDFILWPENSTDVDPTVDRETAQLIDRATEVAELPILVGAVMRGPGEGERQTSALWRTVDSQIISRYDKRNLVPFGEWIPLRDQLLPILPVLQQVGAQSVPGTGPGVLEGELADGRSVTVGDVICFELAWDSTVHDTVTHGAQLLVVQSNNGTYTGTGQPRQQFAITRARAMELRREIVVATTNSLSGLVLPDGTVQRRTQEGTAAAFTVTVPLRHGLTPAVRIGPVLELVASFAAMAVLVLSGLQSLRRRAQRAG
ncbi:apolipoprotein N-acyltransferase [Luteococcus sp. Sow4_B9]|uniref:apolipoprotein N-acyltransferase n=1 Tax=Luteococcus sp. Sow4_B9 TaxID=3438792 RepID=UPI003F94819E